MAEQIRITFAVDEGLKKLIDDGATRFCKGSVSDYVRGLIVLHSLIRGESTGDADIPGWVFGNYPLGFIEYVRQARVQWMDTLKAEPRTVGDHVQAIKAIVDSRESSKQQGKKK